MINQYFELYKTLDEMSNKLNCGTCGICENDSIYLLPDEVPVFNDLKVDLVEIDGVHFLAKNPRDNQYCPFRDFKTRSCTIYDKRPAVCRMFPLEIKKVSDEYWWGICLYCPKVASSRDDFRNCLIQHIPEIELHLNKELISFLGYADRTCSRIDAIAGLPTKTVLIRPVFADKSALIVDKNLFNLVVA